MSILKEELDALSKYGVLKTEMPEVITAQLLFHMATGSGKTLIMAAAMLYLYQQGYRNFIFFVNSTNIIEKTRDNFMTPRSSKYLFALYLKAGDRRVNIQEVENFQAVNPPSVLI